MCVCVCVHYVCIYIYNACDLSLELFSHTGWYNAPFLLCRTTVHSITTQPSMIMTETTWEIAVTTAPTTTTQIRLTQTTMGKETPVLQTLMEMVRHPLTTAGPWLVTALSPGCVWFSWNIEAGDSSSYLSPLLGRYPQWTRQLPVCL